jgi:GAF domain-containing protein
VTTAPELTEIERVSFENYGARSVIIIPLRVPNHVIGAVWISAETPYRHSDREMRVYQSFGEQASIAMQARYLLEQTERRARQMETTAEVSSAAGKILDLEKLMPMIVGLIRDAFGYNQAQIFLMDKNDEYAELRASTGEAGRMLLANRHRLAKGSQSVVGQATLRGEAFVARDTFDADVVHKPNI